jgi:hypothetical protein
MIARTRQWLDERRSAFCRSPFGCLVGLFLNRTFRGAADAEAGELDLGVAVILVLLAMPGLLVSLLMLEKYGSLIRFLAGQGAFDPSKATIPDEYLFIVLSVSVTGAAALWRWDSIFLDRRDYSNLVPLPLSLGTIFFANFCAILLLAGAFSIVANGASLVLFPIAVVGSRPSLSLFLRFAAGHAAAVLAASVFSFFAIFALAGLLAALLPPSAFRRVSLSIRFASVVILLVLLATSLSVPDLLKRLSVVNAQRIAVLPPVSFLGIARSIWVGASDSFSAGMARAAMMGVGLAVLVAVATYAVSFRRSFLRLPELADARPMTRISSWVSPLAFFRNLGFRPSPHRACCQFVSRSLLRSTAHRETLLCFLAAGLVISAETFAAGPHHVSAGRSTAPAVEFLTIPFILGYAILVGIRFAFEIPLDLRANWIFRLWLDADRHDARSVARRVLLLFSLSWMAPLILVSTLAFWGWMTALLHTAIWCASTVVLVEILLVRFRKMPFTCAYPSFQSHSPLIVVGYLFGFYVFKSWVPQFDQWSLLSPINAVWFILLLGGVFASLYWYRNQMLDMDKRLTFEDLSARTFS